jgi:hypothetical protein
MVAESKGADLLLLEGVPGLPALQVAAADQPGELIKILGHGYLYPTWEIDGHIIGDFNTIAFFPIPFTETIISCEPAKGHSGSPALDPQGNVVGVVSMGAMGVGGLVRLQDIQAFLKGY